MERHPHALTRTFLMTISSASAVATEPTTESGLKIDSRSCIIDGKRRLLLCGAIHYPRSTPAMWPGLMRSAKDAGLNCVETYVCWNQHEAMRGSYDFSDNLDLKRFCQSAADAGLYVFLRPGPYICAEQDFGGFPAWLRDVPGIRFRTRNQPYYTEVKRWFDHLFAYIRPLLRSSGGPIIALQVENEFANISATYGADGVAYMEWLRDLMAGYGAGVPLTTCNPAGDDGAMAALDHVPGTVPTINSGFAHPFVRAFRKWAPDYPCLWTEAWMAWYQVWGLPRPWRPASDMTYCSARFFAEGGKGINYFLWHGGTNFGRQAMYLQVTQYEFDATMDEFGCPSAKFDLLKSLHAVLLEYEDVLVENDLPEAHDFSSQTGVRIFRRGTRVLEFVFNDAPAGSAAVSFEHAGQTWRLPGQTIVAIGDGAERWRVEGTLERDAPKRKFVDAGVSLSPTKVCDESIPQEGWIEIGKPREQLTFTRNRSDYAWYRTQLDVPAGTDGIGILDLVGINDVFQVFVDGRRVAVSASHLIEDRGSWDGPDYRQQIELQLSAGRHELALLVCSLGLVKGDWQAGRRNMVEERKGFWGKATWRSGNAAQEISGWQIHPALASRAEQPMKGNDVSLAWRQCGDADIGAPLRWFEKEFDWSRRNSPVALHLGGMGKGLAWINGHCIGRYWLIRSHAPTVIHTEHNQVMHFEKPGTPSQEIYHVPSEWLREGRNSLRLFEELGGDPQGIKIVEWKAISPP